MKRRRKAQSKAKETISFLNEMNINNTKAMEEGPIKKKWHIHDLNVMNPLTPNQEDMFHAFYNGSHICAQGSAGTGKTFLALYLAFQEILDHKFPARQIIIVRSNVPSRDIGFLPGTEEEKMSVYELPYHDICEELFGKSSTYDDMKKAGLIKFMSTSHVRGLTWDDSVVIVEECQNLNFHEIDSIMTRTGRRTRLIVTGDVPQADLPHNGKDQSGMRHFLEVIRDIDDFVNIRFTEHDIVRSDFVKSWIIASQNLNAA